MLSATKQHILVAAKYKSDCERDVYFSFSTRKVFSIEFIDHLSDSELEGSIEDTHQPEWRFYFNSGPSETMKGEILESIASGRGRRDCGESEI